MTLRYRVEITADEYHTIPLGACLILDWNVFQKYRYDLLKDKTCYIISDLKMSTWYGCNNVFNNGKAGGVLSFIYKTFEEAERNAYYALKEVYILTK